MSVEKPVQEADATVPRPGGPGEARNWRRSLSLRLAFMLSLALLPLGLIAVDQTVQLQRELKNINSLNMARLTAEFAQRERMAVESAFGAASGLATAMSALIDDPEACSRELNQFVERSGGQFVFAGFLPPGGVMTCTSSGRRLDLSEDPNTRDLMLNPRRMVQMLPVAPSSGIPVVAVNLPFTAQDGTLAGYIRVSIPHRGLKEHYDAVIGDRPMELLTLNANGSILSASGALENAANRLPADRPVSDLVSSGSQWFVARNKYGQERVYSVVPVVQGHVYAVGAWENTSRVLTGSSKVKRWWTLPGLFPMIMWVVCLLMVIIAIELQVVRPVRQLAAKMRRFGRLRELPEPTGALAEELSVIDDEFQVMATSILRDEAGLMDAMHEKDVLLKEVHHRVKNNLQLISSIVNMQARRTRDPGATRALNDVNQRVNSMATVHRRLYQAENLRRIMADELLRDVIGPLTELVPEGATRPEIELSLDPVALYPDQAVPLALLSVEAMTNALKYAGADASGRCWISVLLEQQDDKRVTLRITNSTAPDSPAEPPKGTELGGQLIKAFASQLEGRVDSRLSHDRFTLTLEFEAQGFDPEGEPAMAGEAATNGADGGAAAASPDRPENGA